MNRGEPELTNSAGAEGSRDLARSNFDCGRRSGRPLVCNL